MDDLDRKIAELRTLLTARQHRELLRIIEQEPPADLLDQLLWKSGEHYQKLLEAVPVPVVIYDSGGKAVFVNQSFINTYGYTREQVLGKKIDFVPEDSVKPTLRAWQRTMNGEEVRFITNRRTRDGDTRVVEINTALIKDRDGEHLACMVIHKDITGAKMAEQAEADKEKLKAAMEITGAVCHEMSQPLQVILCTAELMAMDLDGQDNRNRERLRIIRQYTKRLGAIVKRFNRLTFYKTKPYAGSSQILDLDQSSNEFRQDLRRADAILLAASSMDSRLHCNAGAEVVHGEHEPRGKN